MNHSHRPRGFSLIEIIVTLALAGIVAAAATSATISVYKSTRQLEQEAAVDEDAKILLDSVKTRLRQLGGGSLRPWLAVSNHCVPIGGVTYCTNGLGDSATQHDMIHFIDVTPSKDQCTIKTYNGNNSADVAKVGSTCCVSSWGTAPIVVAVVPPTPGKGWHMKKCTPRDCGCTLAPVPGAPLVKPNDDSTITNGEWVGGLLVPATSFTYYLKPRPTGDPKQFDELHVVDDEARDGTYEDRILHDTVGDLQLQFGYDAAQDGTFDGTWSNTMDTTNATALRMVRLGIIVGARAPSIRTSSRAVGLNGFQVIENNTDASPRHARWRAAVGATALRNLLFFY